MVTTDLANVKIEQEMQRQHWMETVTENYREMHHVSLGESIMGVGRERE